MSPNLAAGQRKRAGPILHAIGLMVVSALSSFAAETSPPNETRAYLFRFCPVTELRGLTGWTPDEALHLGTGQTESAVHETLPAAASLEGTLVPAVMPDQSDLRSLFGRLHREGARLVQWQASGRLFDAGGPPCLVLIEGRFDDVPPRVSARDLRSSAREDDRLGPWNWPTAWRELFQLLESPSTYIEIDLEVAPGLRALRFVPRFADLSFGKAKGPIHRRLVATLALRGIDLPVASIALPVQVSDRLLAGPSSLTGARGLWIPLPGLVDPQGHPDDRLPNGALNIVATLVESHTPLTEEFLVRPASRFATPTPRGTASPALSPPRQTFD